jgi:predicted dehydrogenase
LAFGILHFQVACAWMLRMPIPTPTRRQFLAGTATAAAGLVIVPRHVLAGSGQPAPSDRLHIAVVGAGAQGASNAIELVSAGEQIVALADVDFGFVDRTVAGRARGRDGQPNAAAVQLQEAYGRAKRYADFRRMLEQQKDIDAVIVATPDHTHAVAAKASLELGKHVYCEKPLTWSVEEARVLRDLAARTKVATQMGNQGHSGEEARRINEWVQAGVIGPVRDVHIWTNRPLWPQGIPRPASAPGGEPPTGLAAFGNEWSQRRVAVEIAEGLAADRAVPSGVEWDLFLGPAPLVPYHPLYHPFNWRGWVDWGTGALGDMAAHLMDHPYWALGLTYPTSVEATSTPFGTDEHGAPASFPVAMEVAYRFPARGSQPPVLMTWRDGGLMPPRPPQLPDGVALQRGGGVIVVGDKGILLHETYGRNPRLFPESLMEAAQAVPKTYERVEDGQHRVNWARAAKGQATASCPFSYAGPLTETMLLGVAALKTGQGVRIEYDGTTGRITNNDAANAHLRRVYREGWTL